jgi:hypothetical protein
MKKEEKCTKEYNYKKKDKIKDISDIEFSIKWGRKRDKGFAISVTPSMR